MFYEFKPCHHCDLLEIKHMMVFKEGDGGYLEWYCMECWKGIERGFFAMPINVMSLIKEAKPIIRKKDGENKIALPGIRITD
jgi:hypothetical protein